MRNTVAKRLRREVYGDLSLRGKTYGRVAHRLYKTRKDKDGKDVMYFVNKDTIVCKPPRRDYLVAKDAYKRG